MKHDQLKQKVLDALNKLFADDSVPQATTEESLKEIREEIEGLLAALND